MNSILWTILFCFYAGSAQEPDGKIVIRQQSVEAFGVTWEVTHANLPDTTKQITHGGIGLRYIQGVDTVQAHMGIYPERIIFIVDKEIAEMKRIN
jgi:hypothetical protein